MPFSACALRASVSARAVRASSLRKLLFAQVLGSTISAQVCLPNFSMHVSLQGIDTSSLGELWVQVIFLQLLCAGFSAQARCATTWSSLLRAPFSAQRVVLNASAAKSCKLLQFLHIDHADPRRTFSSQLAQGEKTEACQMFPLMLSSICCATRSSRSHSDNGLGLILTRSSLHLFV